MQPPPHMPNRLWQCQSIRAPRLSVMRSVTEGRCPMDQRSSTCHTSNRHPLPHTKTGRKRPSHRLNHPLFITTRIHLVSSTDRTTLTAQCPTPHSSAASRTCPRRHPPPLESVVAVHHVTTADRTVAPGTARVPHDTDGPPSQQLALNDDAILKDPVRV